MKASSWIAREEFYVERFGLLVKWAVCFLPPRFKALVSLWQLWLDKTMLALISKAEHSEGNFKGLPILCMIFNRLELYSANIASLDRWLPTIRNNRIRWSCWFSRKIASLTIVSLNKMNNHENTFKNHENHPETMWSHENSLENHKNQPKYVKTITLKSIVNNG